VLGRNVLDREHRCRDPVSEQRVAEGPDRRVRRWLQQQFHRGLAGRADGQPAVAVAERDVGAQLEAQDVGVEVQRLGLIIDEDARKVDTHGSLLGQPPGHRVAQRSEVEGVELVATITPGSHQPRLLEHVQVLRDRLACEAGLPPPGSRLERASPTPSENSRTWPDLSGLASPMAGETPSDDPGAVLVQSTMTTSSQAHVVCTMIATSRRPRANSSPDDRRAVSPGSDRCSGVSGVSIGRMSAAKPVATGCTPPGSGDRRSMQVGVERFGSMGFTVTGVYRSSDRRIGLTLARVEYHPPGVTSEPRHAGRVGPRYASSGRVATGRARI
jgi:hypothetical protein